MSYDSVEGALQAMLAQTPQLDAVIRGDFSQLSSGYNRALVLLYGGFAQELAGARGDNVITWHIFGELYTRYSDDAQVHLDAAANRWNVIQMVNVHPQLLHAAGVVRIDITSGSSGGTPPGGGPLANASVGEISYYRESLLIEIDEVTDVAYQE